MDAKTTRSRAWEGCIRIPEEIKGECHLINEPIRVSASHQRRNIFTIKNPIVIKAHEPIQAGTLVKVAFDLKGPSRHRFGDADLSPRGKILIGIGQVFKTIKSDAKRYKIFIRPLEFHLARRRMIEEHDIGLTHHRPSSRFSR